MPSHAAGLDTHSTMSARAARHAHASSVRPPGPCAPHSRSHFMQVRRSFTAFPDRGLYSPSHDDNFHPYSWLLLSWESEAHGVGVVRVVVVPVAVRPHVPPVVGVVGSAQPPVGRRGRASNRISPKFSHSR